MSRSGLILVEGADASGKTTLVNHLVEHHGARTMHGRVWRDMLRWHCGMMRRALRLIQTGGLVVLDRHWVSELIYGPIFRGGAAYANDTAAAFDQAICEAPGVYVLCVPSDTARHVARFEELKRTRREAFTNVEAVIQRYQDLLFGNVAHPGGNAIDLFIRYQDFTVGRMVHHHDIHRSGSNVRQTTKRVLEMIGR